ncbi:MAG: putative porin [Deltaproteobacteria bacterium]|nr:putative porin [Deltaproteobacteria bacterium]
MRCWTRSALIAVLGTLWGLPASADGGELTDMVEIMREEGVIDDSQYSQMRSKAERRDAETHWWERLTFSGDMRMRYESFVYDKDVQGNSRANRGRARYRARLRLEADINDHIDAVVRLTTGRDSRSTNQTLGRGADFDPDEIFFDRAYLVVTPLKGGALPGGESGYFGVEIGRMSNPFFWSKKVSPDYLLWDHDIGLEGIQMKTSWDAANAIQLFLRGGYYEIQEVSRGSDPGLIGAQIGANVRAADKVKVGGRVTYFGFNNVSSSFLERGVSLSGGSLISCPGFVPGADNPALDCSIGANATSAAGNTEMLPGGGPPFGLTDDSHVHVIEGSVYVALDFIEDWPITAFGNVSSNLSAQNLGHGEQDLAWLVGVQTGDKKKFVNAGFVYEEIEADAFPSQFIDSDITDGRTNRKGLSFWLARQILENTDLKFEALYGEELETASPLFDKSTRDARRWRMRGDVQVKF